MKRGKNSEGTRFRGGREGKDLRVLWRRHCSGAIWRGGIAAVDFDVWGPHPFDSFLPFFPRLDGVPLLSAVRFHNLIKMSENLHLND